MSIASDLIRGHIDTIVLARLMAGDSYGYDINKAILAKSGGCYELKEASLYTALRRLEQGGCIFSYWGDENSGARRRYYSITEAGRGRFARLVREWDEGKALIDRLIHLNDDLGGSR